MASLYLVNDSVHFGTLLKRLTFSLCSGDKRLADVPDRKHSRSLHIIPVLLCEGVDTGSRGEEGREGRQSYHPTLVL